MQERVWHSGVVSIRKVWGHACACCERALGLRALTGEPTKNNMNRVHGLANSWLWLGIAAIFGLGGANALFGTLGTLDLAPLGSRPGKFIYLVGVGLGGARPFSGHWVHSLWSNACELAKRICNPGTVNSIVLSRACLCRTGIRTYARTYVRT